MSATLSDDVHTLKGLFCRDPVVLVLEDAEDAGGGVSQFVVRCGEDEKFLLLYVIIKLKLIKGKIIVFVGNIDRCYRLKLYLEQFGTKSCVLNSELPVNSRIHVVEEFNKNVYDIVIATDEHEILGPEEEDPESSIQDEGKNGDIAENEVKGPAEHAVRERAKKRRRAPKSREYGVSRGIDFKNVACVLNFDLPTTSNSYTHRIGRTARAGNTGMALSFAVPKDLYRKHKATTVDSAEKDEDVLSRITKTQARKGREVKPYHFDMKQVEAFRYRMGDALRAVTRTAVREARTRELRQELLSSEKLKRHFEENPGDLHHLRHDGELRAARVQTHLRHVPEYLIPSGGREGIARDVGFVGIGKTNENRIRKARIHNRAKGKGKTVAGRKADPLKSFTTKGKR
ncbi:MAG: ATP-dependent DNA/RNA helicase [Thelocarpon impressellum]|nr:MAG: ATP-dependent DNA/RNA helicase [Thelocarpon impressellum]